MGAFPTSYIKTEASAATRAADSASMTGTNFSSWYRQNQGTLYGEGKNIGTNVTIMAIQDSTNPINNRISITNRQIGVSDVSAIIYAGNIDQGTSFGNFPFTATNKISLAYAPDDMATTVNGATVTTDTSTKIPVVNTLYIGGMSSAFPASHVIRKIAYYPARLSNAELQGLTTP